MEWSSSAGLTVAERELRDLLRGGGASPPSSDSPLEARLVRVPPRFSHNYYRWLRVGGAQRTATIVKKCQSFPPLPTERWYSYTVYTRLPKKRRNRILVRLPKRTRTMTATS